MIRNLKALGLALVAMLALGATSASAAEFHSETSPTTLTASQVGTNALTIEHGIQFHCKIATFEGTTTTNTTTSITVQPSYQNCTATIFGSATIHTNDCKYALTSHGTVAITGCTNAAKSIVITAPFCTVEVPEAGNSALEKVTFNNAGSGTTREVEVVANITNIKYNANGFACPFGNGRTGGVYQGTVKVTGENPTTKAHHGIWWQ